MDLRTTWEVDLSGLGALSVEEGEGSDQNNTQVSNLEAILGRSIYQGKQVWVKVIWRCRVQRTGGSYRVF